MSAPIENKVWASTVGGSTGVVVSTFFIWLLGITLWGASADALSATEAIAAVPGPVIGLIGLLITGGSILFSGWWAKHTPRPDLAYVPKHALIEGKAPAEVDDKPEEEAQPAEAYVAPEYAPADVKPDPN